MVGVAPGAVMLNLDELPREGGARPIPEGCRLHKIDDSDTGAARFPSLVVVATRIRLLVVLAPPLLAELAARRLAPLDVVVVVPAGDGAVSAGHYDAVIRNVALPPGVTADLVVDLPAPAGFAVGAVAGNGEVVAFDRIDEVAALVARRWGREPRGA